MIIMEHFVLADSIRRDNSDHHQSKMEEKKKFVCKYCNKKYPCGKSLGGHIRTHMMSSEHHSSQSKVRTINDHKNIYNNADEDSGRKRKRDSSSGCDNNEVFSASENPIYGLRENPKKTTRFVHSNNNKQKERFCKECGKGFLSLKALCGHMACHSEKDKGGFCEKQQKLVMDSQSDTETSAQNHPRRSRRMRFKTINSSNNNSNNNLNSSSVSEVEQEQEEVARCLMLLSKDSSYKGPCFVLPPPTESSDNNSVVLEAAKSLSNGRKSSVSNGFEEEKKKKKEVVMMMQQHQQKDMKLKKSAAADDDEFVCFSDNSDSGYFRNGPKKLDSDVSVDGSREFKTPRVELRHEYDAESRKKVVMLKNRGKTRNMEPRKLVLEDLECDTTTASRNNNSKFINSKKRSGNYDLLISRNNNPIGVSPNEGSWKQESSLNSEKFINGGSYDDDDDDSAYESDESSTDTDAYPSPKPHVNAKKIISKSNKKKLKSKKSRDHECPICYKIFRSGQALGGHKRSHFVGGSEDNTTLVIKQGPCLIDLNLPAPMDD